MADWEKEHVAAAYTFELGKCNHEHIKERMLWLIAQIDTDLANKVGEGLGMDIPKEIEQPINQAIGADADVKKHQPGKKKIYLEKSKALSMAHTKFDSIATRQIAILAADGFSMSDYSPIKEALEKEGAMLKIVAPHGGTIKCDKGKEHKVDAAIATTESVLFDAIYIPGGEKSVSTIIENGKYIKFINETFKYCKAIAADKEGENVLDHTFVANFKEDGAVHINDSTDKFIKSIAKHRNWDRREHTDKVPV